MVFPEHESIDTKYLQRLFDNMSECYKLFWLNPSDILEFGYGRV